jgi:hypothetical protein
MEIAIDSHHWVEVDPLYTEERGGPSLTVRVRIVSGRFTGAIDEVGLWRDEVERFVTALERLERERAGEAMLGSMSPDEFGFSLRIADRAGHVALTTWLRRPLLSGPMVGTEPQANVVALVERVDPTTLPQILDEFRLLLAFRRPYPGMSEPC